VAEADIKPETKPTAKPAPRIAVASAASLPFLPALSKPDAKRQAKPEAKSAPAPYELASASSVTVTLTSKSDPGASTTVQVPRWASTNAVAPRSAPAVGSEDPIHPVPVRTVLVKPGSPVQTASLAPLQLPAPAEPPAQIAAPATIPATIPAATPAPMKAAVLAFPPPGTRPGAIAGLPSHITTGSVAEAAPAPAPATVAQPVAAPIAPAAPHVSAPTAVPQSPAHVGWMIQVGAFPAEGEAKQRLSAVQTRASRYLASADAFTETVSKGESVLYRARFAGLDKEQAEAACQYLKHNDVDCMTIKN
jgi:D-alanyl-D-alanine carboxypeptidase